MAVLKLSQIAASAVSLIATDVLVGVNAGTTDLLFSGTQIAAFVNASPTITGHATIEGVTATGATGSGRFVFDNTPTLITPVIGVASGTSLALGGATIGTNALAVTGTTLLTGAVVGTSSLRLGTVSVGTGTLVLCNSGSALATTIQAGVNITSARTYTWPIDFGAAGTVLTDAAGNGTLSWAAAGGGLTIGTTAITSGTTTRLLYDLAGVVQEAAGVTVNATSSGLTLTAAATGAASLLTLTGQTGVLAASQPVINATQTWNAAGVTFTGLFFNVTSTASAAGSLLMDLQVGSATTFSVDKTGTISSPTTNIFKYGNLAIAKGAGNGFYLINSNGNKTIAIGGTSFEVLLTSGGFYGWDNNASDPSNNAVDLSLFREATGVLAQRINAAGTSPNTLRVYNTWTDASNYERGVFDWGTTSNVLTIGTQAAGTGTLRPTNIIGADVVIGTAALVTTATDGFIYIPTCAGTPTGVPTAFTGRIPMIYDTTNHQFWFYDSGWKQPKTPAGAAIVTWQ